MPPRAAFARDPRDGIGACTPRLTKLRKLSVKIADGTCSAVEIMMTLKQFGRMCFRMIRPGFAPMERAASMYSFSLIERICPRTRRAIPTQYSTPNTINKEIILLPILSRNVPWMTGVSTSFSTTESRMTISISGSEYMISTIRIMMRSTFPPQ